MIPQSTPLYVTVLFPDTSTKYQVVAWLIVAAGAEDHLRPMVMRLGVSASFKAEALVPQQDAEYLWTKE